METKKTKRQATPPVPVTQIIFDGKLTEREIPFFRGAVMAVAGNNPLYHNHAEDSKDISRYPRIQYKRMNDHPVLVGVAEGAESLKNLFVAGSRHVMKIGRYYREFTVAEVVSSEFMPSVNSGKTRQYRVSEWLAFNSDNFKEYKECPSLAARVAKLDAILIGNIKER